MDFSVGYLHFIEELCRCQFKTDIRKNSFFSKTIVDWNHLEDSIVCAKTVEGFNSSLQQLD
jgi:hypothetical protein